MSVDLLLSKLDKVRKSGKNSWRSCCPGHNGNNPTALSITETDDGMVLLKCHTGCGVDQIVSSVGLELSDLFPEKPIDGHSRKPERLPFNPRDVLAAMWQEAMIVYLCGADIAKGKQLSEQERARLLVAVSRIKAAAEAARAS